MTEDKPEGSLVEGERRNGADAALRVVHPGVSAVLQVAARAERRLRLRRALTVGVSALCVALVLSCVALALRKTGVLAERAGRLSLLACALLPFVAAGVAFARRLDSVPGRAGALALDRFHGLSDRLSSALAFGADVDATPFMQAAIEDAVARLPDVDPRRAVPIPMPPNVAAAGVLACALLGIALFEVRHHVPAAHAATIDAVDVTADDLDAMREFLDQMKAHDQTDEAKAATREFNQLIEDLAARRLDRTEAFRRMQQLEDKLLEGREADAKALEEAMKKIGDEMKAAELTKPAGEALESKNLAAAEKQLQDLAKKLREGRGLDKAQLEKMREALRKAAGSQSKRQEALAQRRDELKQSLLQQRNKNDAGAQDEEKSLLQKRERELERLDRETQQAEATGRQLDRLDRELEKAAEDLMKDLGLSADDLDKSAEDINHMKQDEMTQEEKEQLRQKLQELREMMRQQGQGGQGQMARLRRFQQQAHGQGQGQGQGQQGQGQQGEGEQGEGDQPGQQGEGQQGQGQQGQGQQGQGQGQQGQGRGQGSGETWVLGPNGQKILMLSQGRGSGSSSNGGSGDQPGGGKAYGTGHDGHVEGKATAGLKSQQDSQVAGQDTGQGNSRSEVIEGAAERGFASRGYQKVFREYQTVAEEALGKDEIPGGYRFYVRRYFELIRPRDGTEPKAAP